MAKISADEYFLCVGYTMLPLRFHMKACLHVALSTSLIIFYNFKIIETFLSEIPSRDLMFNLNKIQGLSIIACHSIKLASYVVITLTYQKPMTTKIRYGWEIKFRLDFTILFANWPTHFTGKFKLRLSFSR